MQNITKWKIIFKDRTFLQIDEDEVENVLKLIQVGNGIIRVRQGIFAISGFDRLVEDIERTESCTIKRIDENGKIYYESEKLEDLFEKNKIDNLPYHLIENIKSLETIPTIKSDTSTPEQREQVLLSAREQRAEVRRLKCTLRE